MELNRLTEALGGLVPNPTAPNPQCLEFLQRLAEVVPRDSFSLAHPQTVSDVEWILHRPEFVDAMFTKSGVLVLHGTSRELLSGAANYLGRAMKDNKTKAVAKATLVHQHGVQHESTMLGSLIYQILRRRPARFDRIQHLLEDFVGWPIPILQTALATLIDADDNFLAVVHGIDKAPDHGQPFLSTLQEVQHMVPFNVIATSTDDVPANHRDEGMFVIGMDHDPRRLLSSLIIRTALHLIAEHGTVEMFRNTLDYYLNIWGKSGPSSSFVALKKLLLKNDGSGRNVLHFAAVRGKTDIVEEILIRVGCQELDTDSENGSKNLQHGILLASDTAGDTPLHLASKAGHLQVVKTLCTAGIGMDIVSARNKSERTPLHLACQAGHEEVQVELRQFGAAIHAMDEDNMTPILEACHNGNLDVVVSLFDGGASLLPVPDGTSPLNIAAEKGDTSLATLLVQLYPGNLRTEADHHGRLPFMLAARAGPLALFQQLLVNDEQLATKDNHGSTVLHYAIQGGNIGIISAILENEQMHQYISTANDDGYNPLQLAAHEGNSLAIDMLVEKGAYAIVNTAISCASTEGIALHLLQQSEVYELLHKNDTAMALLESARRGYIEMMAKLTHVEYLGDRSPDCVEPATQKTPFILAAEAGHLEILRHLIGLDGVDATRKDNQGRTALSYAAANGHFEVVELLTGVLGVRTDDEDLKGYTPLLHAANNGHLEVVALLVALGDYQGPDLSPALCAVAEAGYEEAVKLLLEEGADVDIRCPSVNEPDEPEFHQAFTTFNALEHALMQGHPNVIKLLVPHLRNIRERPEKPFLQLACKHPKGLEAILPFYHNVNLMDSAGYTALSTAIHFGFMESVELLLKAGANPRLQEQTGWTALHHAAVFPREDNDGRKTKPIPSSEILEVVLNSLDPNGDIHIPNSNGHTPFLEAVFSEASTSVRTLLARDPTVVAHPSEGPNCPLVYAVSNSLWTIANLILEMGDLGTLTGSHRDLITEAAAREPEVQLRLLNKLPGTDYAAPWVLALVENDHTGAIKLMDFAYVTEAAAAAAAADKTDEEIARIAAAAAAQEHERPAGLVAIGDGVQLPTPTTAAYDGGGGLGGVVGARADHPIPPLRAYYFEVAILRGGEAVGVGLCAGDARPGDIQDAPSPAERADKSARCLYFGTGRVQRTPALDGVGPGAAGDARGFAAGDVIGCHVDAARGVAYWRRNGGRIGLEREVVRVSGRLFPCVVFGAPGCEAQVRFDDGGAARVYEREEE
ncbi:hypothetical protein OQA88_2346 [Cercophora sp. LCS_1]